MGSRIAAHFANAGVEALLLDMVLPGQANRNLAAMRGIETALKQKPGGFFTDTAARLVTPGNFEDDFSRLGDCDWVIEAVTENLDIKRAIWSRVEQVRRPDAILSTNTSGLPLAQISEGFPDSFRRNFLGTHFFNPPRYLHLVEVIPGANTDPEIVAYVSGFCDKRLGKGVVLCKDTPNFIANRIGSFFGATVYKTMIESGYTVEEVDALTGPLIGLPNSASLRLVDIIGLDIWVFVARNLYDAVPEDPWRERFLPPDFVARMMERGWLGDKTGQGFYKRVGKERDIHALDWRTLEYHPAGKPSFETVEKARRLASLPERLQMLVAADDRAGSFLWSLFSDVLLYSAERIPEIADRVVEIDRAMRWGYAHKLGPFELWDALGFEETARRIEREGRSLPETVTRMLSSGASSFYRHADAGRRPRTQYFDFGAGGYVELEERPGILVLSDLKRARGVIKSNAAASLVDLNDGVLCLEFHSKMNTLGEETLAMLLDGLEETERGFEALVIANEGEIFSAGADLNVMLAAAEAGKWDDIERAIQRFQQAFMSLKYAAKPVVAAPFGRALGGGCEVVLHAARVQASAELYMGLVEVGVGLIPAAGGTKEMLLRLNDAKAAFELIGFAKVSGSAADARRLGFLRGGDAITMNPERLLADARTAALALAQSYSPPLPAMEIAVSGEAGYAAMKLGAWTAHEGGFLSGHDLLIADKLAHVLGGGRLSGQPKVTEQYLLDLEREAFLSLCGHPKTQERIRHMLKTGKPLRN